MPMFLPSLRRQVREWASGGGGGDTDSGQCRGDGAGGKWKRGRDRQSCRDGGQDPVVQGPESGGRSGRGEKELPKKGKMAGMGREVDI